MIWLFTLSNFGHTTTAKTTFTTELTKIEYLNNFATFMGCYIMLCTRVFSVVLPSTYFKIIKGVIAFIFILVVYFKTFRYITNECFYYKPMNAF